MPESNAHKGEAGEDTRMVRKHISDHPVLNSKWIQEESGICRDGSLCLSPSPVPYSWFRGASLHCEQVPSKALDCEYDQLREGFSWE